MRSAVLCYAAADADFAQDLARYLELNCSLLVSLDEGRVDSGYDLIEAAGRALSADHPIVLLSPDSVPRTWCREDWEPVLFREAKELGRQVAYLLLRPCKFPDLLRREVFFDLTGNSLAGRRALRRWLLQHDPFFQRATNLDDMRHAADADFGALETLLDAPGVQSTSDRNAAVAFARAHIQDFEGVFWLNCAWRTLAGVVGNTGHELGLALRGRVEENARSLKEFCAGRRLLLAFEHLPHPDAALMASEGNTSYLLVTDQKLPQPATLETTAALFSAWRNGYEKCLQSLGDAYYHVSNLGMIEIPRQQTAISLGSAAAFLLRDRGRLAEAYEFLEMTKDALRARGDLLKAARIEWEMSWIREEWGQPAGPDTRIVLPAQPRQLTLALTD